MLFSEAIHHIRAALDNVIFALVEEENGGTLEESLERQVAMPIYEDAGKFAKRMKELAKRGVPGHAESSVLRARIESLQPFRDTTTISALPPGLTRMTGGLEADKQHPLQLLTGYSNEDKHRSLRLAAGRSLVQRFDDLPRTQGLGMRSVEVGTVLEVVPKFEHTAVEISPALHVRRPSNGVWVGPGFELDSLWQHVAYVAIPTLVTGLALPDGLPAEVDLGDNGASVLDRLRSGTSARAHERGRSATLAAILEASPQDWRIPPLTELGEEDSGDGNDP